MAYCCLRHRGLLLRDLQKAPRGTDAGDRSLLSSESGRLLYCSLYITEIRVTLKSKPALMWSVSTHLPVDPQVRPRKAHAPMQQGRGW